MILPEAAPGADGWVAVALLGRPRGIRGEITAITLSGKPERFDALREVFLFRDAPAAGRLGRLAEDAPPAFSPLAGERLEVERIWLHLGGLVFKFRGIDSITDAGRLSGAEVRVPLSQRTPLEPGEFFQSDLVGCEVIEGSTGDSLGRVQAWEDSGGAGILAVEGGLLIPFVRAICKTIDPAARRIVVELPEGLKGLNRP
jgi:16S rRNA processing protein RimM